jgi:uncharacterized membrane protein YraQ (UPF0718 family)
MIAVIFTLLLWGLALLLVVVALKRGDGTARKAWQRAVREFLWLLPRLAIGVIGAGFLARLLPGEAVAAYLGREAGYGSLVIATLAGMLTPGGPVVGFSLGTAALKAGAGIPQVVAYVTAWSLLSLNRVIIWELPIMPRHVIYLRLAISWPLPFVAGALLLLLQ